MDAGGEGGVGTSPNLIQFPLSPGGQVQAMSKISQRLAREGWGGIERCTRAALSFNHPGGREGEEEGKGWCNEERVERPNRAQHGTVTPAAWTSGGLDLGSGAGARQQIVQCLSESEISEKRRHATDTSLIYHQRFILKWPDLTLNSKKQVCTSFVLVVLPLNIMQHGIQIQRSSVVFSIQCEGITSDFSSRSCALFAWLPHSKGQKITFTGEKPC